MSLLPTCWTLNYSFMQCQVMKLNSPPGRNEVWVWPLPLALLETCVPNPFWDSKPELFSDIAFLRIPYQPCIVLFRNFFSGTTASNRRELRLHLNFVATGAGVFKSRYILLHKYVNRIMITYLWRQIQLIIPSRRFMAVMV